MEQTVLNTNTSIPTTSSLDVPATDDDVDCNADYCDATTEDETSDTADNFTETLSKI